MHDLGGLKAATLYEKSTGTAVGVSREERDPAGVMRR